MGRPPRKQETPTKYFDPQDPKLLVYEVFRKSKKTVYYLRGSQGNHLSKVTLDGFDGLPSGLFLYKRGFGFGRKGTFLLSAIKEHIGAGKPVALCISRRNTKSIEGSSPVTVTLPYDEVHNLLVRLGRINEDSNNELRETVASFLSTKFPKRVQIGSATFDDYQGGEIASVLRRNKVVQKLRSATALSEDFRDVRQRQDESGPGGTACVNRENQKNYRPHFSR
jgi:hypothetical protein